MKLNIRQSPLWEKYMKYNGWTSVRLSTGFVIFFYHTPFGSFGKTQRLIINTAAEFKEIDEVCKKERALFLKIEVECDQNLRKMERYGFIKSPTFFAPPKTVFIDLRKSQEEIWKGISHTGKNEITRGQKEKTMVFFHQNPTEEQLRDYFNKVEKYTSKTKNFYGQPFSDLLLRKKAFENSSFLLLSYDNNDNLCGGKFFITYGDTVYYSNGGTTKLGHTNNSGAVLMWEAILFFKKMGYKQMDLGGIYDKRFHNATKKWQGFSNFKLKFSKNVLEYPEPYIKYYSWPLKVLGWIRLFRL